MENPATEITSNKKNAATFLTEDFLLQNEFARRLYHDYAKDLPVIDYHNHLSPREIAENKKFENLTAIWLKGDHYKWRAMRAFGIPERFITGDAKDEDKFRQWAKVVPGTLMNPLFHWTQMELLKPFGINEYLNEDSARAIYAGCSGLLQQDKFSTRSLLQKFNVEMLGTTDDPCDDLQWHRQIREEVVGLKVLPSFRPDKALNIKDRDSFMDFLDRLETCSGIEVNNMTDLLEALQQRVNFFHANGCRVADHGLSQMPAGFKLGTEAVYEFARFLKDPAARFSQPGAFAGFIVLELCKMYHAKDWVQQFHLGALRNNNRRMLLVAGPDTGYDSIGDYTQGETLSAFLNELDTTDQLAKTILYNLNPADNELFAAMTGNFNGGGIKGKIQYGAAWWFLDQKDGIEKQLNTLANMSLLSTFIGMTTDSRSFLSYSRHEYFRRILCDLLGKEVQKGQLPDDIDWIGKMVQDVCYKNAKEYFTFDRE
ncbi:MAG TPA: glucuronate isomerase [Chitinophagaceae bacterium]|jgi:glucuronate isomerase|nr:glucuronate isomerase [Chitinophagaceae bacterium]